MNPSHLPTGYHSVTAYLIVQGAARAIEFYKNAFGATELFRIEGPNGQIGHAEIQIGDSRIMLADEHPQFHARGPEAYGGTPVSLLVYVPDCDAVFNQATTLGAKIVKPLQDQFYGDRSGHLRDPFGHEWSISTHKEDVPPEEVRRRAAALYGPAA